MSVKVVQPLTIRVQLLPGTGLTWPSRGFSIPAGQVIMSTWYVERLDIGDTEFWLHLWETPTDTA